MQNNGQKKANERIRGHKLMTTALRKCLPDLYGTDGQGEQAWVQVKYFTPDSSWCWYATEFDGEDIFSGWWSVALSSWATSPCPNWKRSAAPGGCQLSETSTSPRRLWLKSDRDMKGAKPFKTLALPNGKADMEREAQLRVVS